MKKTLVLGLAAIITGGVAYGQYSISTDLTFASEYIFRGVKLGDNTFHPSVEISQGEWYGGLWAALPIDNRGSQGWGDEYDFYVGFAPKLSDVVSLDVGLTHYYYPTADSTTEAFIGVNSVVSGFTPGLYLYYDFDLEFFTAQANLGFSVPMDNLGTTLDLSAAVGTVNPDEGDSYAYYSVGAAVPFRLNENATLKFGVTWSANDLDIPDDSFLFWTAGLTVGF